MIEVSCFYVHYNRDPVNFTFIKYDKFMKIIVQKRKIIIKIENLKNYKTLYQFYILSLLCTEDTSKIYYVNDDVFDENQVVCGISTQKYWKNLYFSYYYEIIILEKNYFKNPFFSQEPKRETSIKKQKKLFKMISNYDDDGHIFHPLCYINNFQYIMINDLNMEKVIQYERQIYLLCCIRGFNRDIYTNIKKFLKV